MAPDEAAEALLVEPGHVRVVVGAARRLRACRRGRRRHDSRPRCGHRRRRAAAAPADGLELDHRRIAALLEVPVPVVDVGDPAAHAGREVAPGAAEHHRHPPGHVLAAVVAHPFHHRDGSGVADREPLAGDPPEVALPGDRPVEDRVPDEDVLLGREARFSRGVDRDAPAREALADVVVRVPLELDAHPAREERAEALPARAPRPDVDGVVGKAGVAVALGHLAREHRSHRALGVPHLRLDPHRRPPVDGGAGLPDELVVEGAFEPVVLLLAVVDRDPGGRLRLVQDAREVEPARLGVLDRAPHVEALRLAHHVLEPPEPELRHQLAHLLGDEEEVVDDVLGLAGELRAKGRVLGRHPHRAGVEVALAHHDAAARDEGGGGEAELVGAEQGPDDHVPPGADPAVHLDRDAPPERVEDEGLVGLREPDLPRRPRVLDGGERARPGAAVVPRDGHVVRAALGDPGRHRPDPHLGDQLHADPGLGVDVLEIVYELGEVLDRVDVVVRRRGDEAHPRRRVAHPGDRAVHLVPGKLPALAGLRALRDLDLELVGVDEVLGGHPEAPGGDLLDGGAHRVPVRERPVALGQLAALPGVRPPADPVHRDREVGVGLVRDRPERHRAGREPPDDGGGRLHLVEGDGGPVARLREPELEEPPQGEEAFALLVDEGGELPEGVEALAAHRVLELRDRLRGPHVGLAPDAERVVAARVERVPEERGVAPRLLVAPHRVGRDLLDADALHPARGAGEVAVHEPAREPDGIEDLRPAIGLVGGDPHLGHDLEQPLADGLDEAGLELLVGAGRDQPLLAGEGGQGLVGEPGVHRLGPVAGEGAEVVDLARRPRLHDEAGLGAEPGAHEVVVDGGGREQGGDRHVERVHRAVGEDEDVVVAADRLLRLRADPLQRRLHPPRALLRAVADVDGARAEPAAGMGLDLADRLQLAVGEDRLLDLDPPLRARPLEVEEVRARPDDGDERHHELFADGVDGGVGDLREVLPEVVREGLRTRREHRDRVVRPHRPDRLLRALGHRGHEELEVLAGVAERLLALEQRLVRGRRLGAAVRGKVLQPDLGLVEPPLPGARCGKLGLQLPIADDAALLQVDEQHPPRLEPPLADDPVLGDVEHPDLGGHDDPMVVGDDVARRAQPVPVEGRADLAAVGERDRGGAVPGLHEGRVVLVEGAAGGVHQGVVLPRLRDHEHHGVGEGVAARDQQLQGVVERGGVRDPLADDRPQLVEVLAEQGRAHAVAARVHPVDVPADGVDLPVVAEEAVGMGELPRGEGVGGEPLVDEGEGGLRALVHQVGVVGIEPCREHHALVADGAGGEGDDVEAAAPEAPALDRARDDLADDEELALERVHVRAARPAADEHLADPGLAGLDALAEDGGVDRHVAPAEEALPLRRDGLRERLLAGAAGVVVLRQEHHPHAVAARRGEIDAKPRAFLAKQPVGELDQDPGPVARQRVGPDRAAMPDVAEELHPLPHDVVARPVADVRDEPDAARIVLVRGVVESLGGG